jgi:hypothetical protein
MLTITIATVVLMYGTEVSIRVMLTCCCWSPTTPALENVHQLRHYERDQTSPPSTLVSESHLRAPFTYMHPVMAVALVDDADVSSIHPSRPCQGRSRTRLDSLSSPGWRGSTSEWSRERVVLWQSALSHSGPEARISTHCGRQCADGVCTLRSRPPGYTSGAAAGPSSPWPSASVSFTSSSLSSSLLRRSKKFGQMLLARWWVATASCTGNLASRSSIASIKRRRNVQCLRPHFGGAKGDEVAMEAIASAVGEDLPHPN